MAIDWDALYELAPADTTYVKDTDNSIRSLKTATRERVTKEHEFDLASQARQGLHRAGSAVAFYQASAPTQRNGVDLAAEDIGLLWAKGNALQSWDGSAWGLTGSPPTEVRLTSGSGDWTVPAGVYRLRVKCIGGGGGGGGGFNKAGGGGGGTNVGVVPWTIVDTTPGATIAYAVGAAGAGGTGDTGLGYAGPGAAGGTTTFGAISAAGGGGGTGSGATTGPGGTAPTGAYGERGERGKCFESSSGNLYIGGRGGGSLGGQGVFGAVGDAGNLGGGGGGGSMAGNNGGAGGSGLIIIEY